VGNRPHLLFQPLNIFHNVFGMAKEKIEPIIKDKYPEISDEVKILLDRFASLMIDRTLQDKKNKTGPFKQVDKSE